MSIGEIFGRNKPENEKRREIEELRANKAGLHDQVEELKEEKKLLEKQFLKKGEEHDAAKGDSRNTITGEMGLLHNQLERLGDRDDILRRGIENVNIAIAKAQETLAAMAPGVTEGKLDDIALEAEEEFKKRQEADEVASELDDVKYQAPKEKEADIAGRLEKLNEQGKSNEEAVEELPAAIADRLKKLKGDDEKETASEEE